MRARLLPIPVLLVFFAAGAYTQEPADPAAWPARDTHEGLLVAADPYHDAARAKIKFGKKNPVDFGILPVEVVFRNDNDKPILVDIESIRGRIPRDALQGRSGGASAIVGRA